MLWDNPDPIGFIGTHCDRRSEKRCSFVVDAPDGQAFRRDKNNRNIAGHDQQQPSFINALPN
jgi:hypothetical protein